MSAHGAIVMQGAQVDGQLSLRTLTVTRRPDGRAIVLDGTSVRGSFLASQGLTVHGDVWMRGVALGFGRESGASLATSSVEFADAVVDGDLALHRSKLFGNLNLSGMTIGGRAQLERCSFRSNLTFARTTFGKHVIDLRAATFEGPVEVELDDPDLTVDLRFARVVRPMQFKLNVKRTNLTGASLEAETTVEAAGELECNQLRVRAASTIRKLAGAPGRLHVSTLRDASFDATLTIAAEVDVGMCVFQGAQNVDRVVLTTIDSLRVGWSGRHALFEEHVWRSSSSRVRGRGWRTRWPVPGELEMHGTEALDPGEIALLYRGLRKGLEDSKNAPGAADFYFGEMEMRRASTRRRGERKLLTAYWFVCGYGLRALRAFAAVLLTIVASTTILVAFGFESQTTTSETSTVNIDSQTGTLSAPQVVRTTTVVKSDRPSVVETVLFASHAGLSLPQSPDVGLTTSGAATRALLRVVLPVLLGLLFFCLRSQVHR
jgi:hypothetical protein